MVIGRWLAITAGFLSNVATAAMATQDREPELRINPGIEPR